MRINTHTNPVKYRQDSREQKNWRRRGLEDQAATVVKTSVYT